MSESEVFQCKVRTGDGYRITYFVRAGSLTEAIEKVKNRSYDNDLEFESVEKLDRAEVIS